MCAGLGSGGNFRKVPEGSSVCWCSFRRQLSEGSGRFRTQLPEGSGGFHVGSRGNFRNIPEGSSVCWSRFWRQLPEGSGGSSVCWCSFRRFRRQLPEGSGGFHIGSRDNFRNVPEGSSVCWCRFRRQLPEGSGGFRRVPVFRKVQENFGVVSCLATFGDDIVHMGKTIAEQECAHVKGYCCWGYHQSLFFSPTA